MIKVYHSPLSRSVRVLWILEEIGLPYDVERIDVASDRLKSAAYLEVHPLGKVPAIEDGDVTMFESGAIVEYLVERYADNRLAPAIGTPPRGRYLQWIHFSETTALPPLGDFAQHTIFRPEAARSQAVVEDALARVAAVLAILEKALSGRPYLLGDEFLAADVMIGYAVKLMGMMGLLTKDYPGVVAYLERLEMRPGFQKALS